MDTEDWFSSIHAGSASADALLLLFSGGRLDSGGLAHQFLARSDQQEMRWHLARMVPRLAESHGAERRLRVILDPELHVAGAALVPVFGHQVQGHVDAARCATGGHDRAILDPAPLVVRRAQVLLDPAVRPVGGG